MRRFDGIRYFFAFLFMLRGLLMAAGAGLTVYSLFLWNTHNFGATDPARLVRVVASTIVLFTIGVEICLASFFLSILGLRRK